VHVSGIQEVNSVEWHLQSLVKIYKIFTEMIGYLKSHAGFCQFRLIVQYRRIVSYKDCY